MFSLLKKRKAAKRCAAGDHEYTHYYNIRGSIEHGVNLLVCKDCGGKFLMDDFNMKLHQVDTNKELIEELSLASKLPKNVFENTKSK